MVSDYAENIVAFHLKDCRVIRFAKASRARRNLREYAFQVPRRAGDDLQDLRGGGLLLSRPRELTLGLGEFLSQLLNPAFRRAKIVSGRSCHDYTRFPATCPCGCGLPRATGQPVRLWEFYAIWGLDGMSSPREFSACLV